MAIQISKVLIKVEERILSSVSTSRHPSGYGGPVERTFVYNNSRKEHTRKFLSNRTGASKRDIWTRAGNVIAPSLKY